MEFELFIQTQLWHMTLNDIKWFTFELFWKKHNSDQCQITPCL